MYNGFIVEQDMLNHKKYDGNTLKFGITVNGTDYIVKLGDGHCTSLYSEHIASRFIRELGVSCHETWLGYCNNELVVILKDFTTDKIRLRAFKDTRQSSEGTDLSNKGYTYQDVLDLINKHTKMSEKDKQNMLDEFWTMYICDAILGNRDRHHGNWGYLASENWYKPAPIYDNGGSLFPGVDNVIGEMEKDTYKFIVDRAEKFPASLFRIKDSNGDIKRTNYYGVLGNLDISEILAEQVKNLKRNAGYRGIYTRICNVVDEVSDIVPYEYRIFYILIVCVRYLHIIERVPIEEAYGTVWRSLNGSFP